MTLSNGSLVVGTLGTDSLSGFTGARLVGGDGANVLDASAFTLGAVELSGGGGDDTLRGGSGDDTLTGGAGVDSLDGGAGTNTIVEIGSGRFVLGDSSLDMGEGTSAVQGITLTGTVTGGTFTLGYGGQTTRPIASTASPSDVRDALTALDAIGTADVIVTAIAGGWSVAFTGALAGRAIAPLVATSALVGGSVAVATTTAGSTRVNTLANIQSAWLVGGDSDDLLDA